MLRGAGRRRMVHDTIAFRPILRHRRTGHAAVSPGLATVSMNAPPTLALEHPFAVAPQPGESIAVAPGVRWLRMPLPFALDHVNLWLVGDASDTAIVDCGLGDAPTRAAWRRHFDGALSGCNVTKVVATHYHPDHLGNAAWLAAHFGCAVTTTQAEFMQAHAIWNDDGALSGAAQAAFLVAHGLDAAHVDALQARGNAYRRGVPELPGSRQRLIDGDEIRLGTLAFRVITGFGHSPEHAALHAASAHVLISGDMLLPRISTNVSASPLEPDGDPLARFVDSLARFEHLPDETLVLPSHGLPFRGIMQRVDALRAHHRARLSELEAFVGERAAPVSAADAVPVLFRRTLDLQQRFFAMGEAIAHLNHLWHRGRVERSVDNGGAIRYRART